VQCHTCIRDSLHFFLYEIKLYEHCLLFHARSAIGLLHSDLPISFTVLATVDNQNCPFYGIVKNVKRALPLRSSRRDGQTIYIWNVQFRIRIKELCLREDASTSEVSDPLSEVPRNLGAGSQNFRQT
jgi:hypothetical protein